MSHTELQNATKEGCDVGDALSTLTPILQSYMVKSNLLIDLARLFELINITNSTRSGTITALKYKDYIKGNANLFKTKNGFKNACHLTMIHTLDSQGPLRDHEPHAGLKGSESQVSARAKGSQRIKKIVHIKITAIGTFQVVGVPVVDVEKIIYKIFLALEKLNKNFEIFQTKTHYRLEIVIVPILKNYVIKLSNDTIDKIFQNSNVQIIHTFIKHKFLSFKIDNNPAITIKKAYVYNEFKRNGVRYVTWTKKKGKVAQNIEYDSYTTLLSGASLQNAQDKKYVTFRLYTTGKILISGFDETLISKSLTQLFQTIKEF